jgi:hypothetical protein
MPVRRQEEAEERLGRHFSAWAGVVLDSVQEAHDRFGAELHWMELWTQRGIVRDRIVANLIPVHDTTPGLHWWRDGNSTWFGAQNDFIIKPKKLDDHMRACVGDTQLSLEFNRNVPPPALLLDTAPATTLYLGYVPTVNRPLEPPVYLVCPSECGSKAEWVIPLAVMPPSGGVRLPVEPLSPEPGDDRVRIRPGVRRRAQNE